MTENNSAIHIKNCPFYGFCYIKTTGTFIDSQGNQCALVTDSYSPCKMEVEGREVCWNDCEFSNKENRRHVEAILGGAFDSWLIRRIR